ncbi:MAG: hypothetical protein ACRCT1_18520, partial [Microcoleaceae cyanobacterium]
MVCEHFDIPYAIISSVFSFLCVLCAFVVHSYYKKTGLLTWFPLKKLAKINRVMPYSFCYIAVARIVR